jgi:hypothetical protein
MYVGITLTNINKVCALKNGSDWIPSSITDFCIMRHAHIVFVSPRGLTVYLTCSFLCSALSMV